MKGSAGAATASLSISSENSEDVPRTTQLKGSTPVLRWYLFFHDRPKTETMPHVPLPHGREKTVLRRYVEQCIGAVERGGMEE